MKTAEYWDAQKKERLETIVEQYLAQRKNLGDVNSLEIVKIVLDEIRQVEADEQTYWAEYNCFIQMDEDSRPV